MKTISVSEFRGNIKKYLDIAQEEKPYNPEFVAKIMRSKKDFEEGRFTAIKTEDLWK